MSKINDEAVNKVLAGKSDKEEAGEVAHWLATKAGQAYLSARMDREFVEGTEEADNAELEKSKGRVFRSLQKQIIRKQFAAWTLRSIMIATPIAAVIAILFYLNTNIPLFEPPIYQDIYVPKGERMQIAFQDGTRAYLYPGTHIRYPNKFGLTERKVSLDGEAYFEVSKNPHRPFTVELDKAAIRVTGTSFHVQTYTSKAEIVVSLDEGKIDLLYGNQQEYSLNPGESLIYNKEKNACSLHRIKDENGLIQWEEQKITFQNTPMKEVLEALNLHYGVSFSVEDTAVYQYSYTLSLKKPSLDKTIRTLETISSVHFLQGDTIRVQTKQH